MIGNLIENIYLFCRLNLNDRKCEVKMLIHIGCGMHISI